MILLSELEGFAQECVDTIGRLVDFKLVSTDDEANKFMKDVHGRNDQCVLIVVVPSHDPDIENEDNIKFDNNMIFMVQHKTDSKGGADARNHSFRITQPVVKTVFDKVLSLYLNMGDNCVFRGLKLQSFQIDPHPDYFQSNGYILQFVNQTY